MVYDEEERDGAGDADCAADCEGPRGELTIESEEGKGTRVAITLPRGPRPGRYLEAPEDVPRRKPVLPDVIDV